MPDGEFTLGTHVITKCADTVTLPDGTLAGSCLTQQRSLQVLRNWGLDWQAIAQLCSAVPARWLNSKDYGVITTGSQANWLELDEQGAVALWLSGLRQELDGTP